MKNTKLALAVIAVTAAGLFAFKPFYAGTVKGTVSPTDAAVRAWALSATDTFRTNVSNGAFEISNVKPGTYRVIVEANPPYKNAAKENVQVSEGGTTDVGEIRLEK